MPEWNGGETTLSHPEGLRIPEVLAGRHLALDLDDILARLTPILVEHFGRHFDSPRELDDLHTPDLWEVWGTTREEAVRVVHAFAETGEVERLEPVEGAVQHVRQISELNRLSVVTARPSSWQERTEAWLDQHFGNVFDGVYLTNQLEVSGPRRTKSDVIRSIGAEALLDDSAQNIVDCLQNGIPAVLFRHPWNRQWHTSVESIGAWHEAESAFCRALEQ